MMPASGSGDESGSISTTAEACKEEARHTVVAPTLPPDLLRTLDARVDLLPVDLAYNFLRYQGDVGRKGYRPIEIVRLGRPLEAASLKKRSAGVATHGVLVLWH